LAGGLPASVSPLPLPAGSIPPSSAPPAGGPPASIPLPPPVLAASIPPLSAVRPENVIWARPLLFALLSCAGGGGLVFVVYMTYIALTLRCLTESPSLVLVINDIKFLNAIVSSELS
jgi:hypothetical protein